MNFVEDERGQGAAEYILLFGGVIVIAIAALFIYTQYFQGQSGINVQQDLQNVRQSTNQATP